MDFRDQFKMTTSVGRVKRKPINGYIKVIGWVEHIGDVAFLIKWLDHKKYPITSTILCSVDNCADNSTDSTKVYDNTMFSS